MEWPMRCFRPAATGKGLKSTHFFVAAAAVLLTVLVTLLCIGILMRYEVETDVSNVDSVSYWRDELAPQQQLWYDLAIEELERALQREESPPQRARNVLLFLVDGVGPEALALTRFVNATSAVQRLSWERFPYVGKLKNSCSHADVCDAFTAATALFGGVRTTFQLGGVDSGVRYRNCTEAAQSDHRIKSILEQALEAGLRTGLLTTRRITGPFAAGLYAHTADTSWECDGTKPPTYGAAATPVCRDVAQQLLDADVNVLMGGGRQALISRVASSTADPIDERVCASRDGRNIVREWQRRKLVERRRFAVLHDAAELRALNGSRVDYALGAFANGDLQRSGQPTPVRLGEMLAKALEVLRRPDEGFLLVVEAGAEAGSTTVKQARQLLELNAVLEAQTAAEEATTLTLAVFTQGNYVRNVVDTSAETELVSYFHELADSDDAALEQRFHSMPSDTLVYARGPQSQLFQAMHDDTYLAHAVAYALRMGHFRKRMQ